jgi:hypothetical protein
MRRRAGAVFVLLVGGLLVARLLGRSPVEVDITYRLGAAAAHVSEITLRYERAGNHELVRQASFRFPGGAPAEFSHRARLFREPYNVRIDLATGTQVRTVERRLEVSGTNEHIYIDVPP